MKFRNGSDMKIIQIKNTIGSSLTYNGQFRTVFEAVRNGKFLKAGIYIYKSSLRGKIVQINRSHIQLDTI